MAAIGLFPIRHGTTARIYLEQKESSAGVRASDEVVRRLTDKLLTWLVSERWRMPFAAFIAGTLVAGAKVGLALLLLNDPWHHQGLLGLDAVLSGVLAGVMVWILLGLVHGRRRRLIEYVRRVADLNHHIRNALQVIVYQATLAHTDPEQIQQVENAVRRVDAALHEIFPIIGDRKVDSQPRARDLIR
jgi:hypothetical protein